MGEDKIYTLKDKVKFYNLDHIELINSYKEYFELTTKSYCNQSSDFFQYQITTHNIICQIVKMFKISYKDVCLFAFLFDENIDLLKGKMISNSGDHLYFIESKDYIKIGRTRDIKRRMYSLQVHNPDKLNLLFVKYNSGIYEFAIQRMFKYLNEKGEWFKKHKDIYNYVELLKTYSNKENEDRYSPFINHQSNKLMNDI